MKNQTITATAPIEEAISTNYRSKVRQLISRLVALRRTREADARRRNARLRAQQDLYLRDYHGRLYLYHEGRPIVPADSFKEDAFRILDAARAESVIFDCTKD